MASDKVAAVGMIALQPPRDPTLYPKHADWPFRLPRNPDMFKRQVKGVDVV
jgi:hypothetical protein